MSSGYFPLSRRDPWGESLAANVAALKALRSQILEGEEEDISVAEDALSDGMYLGEMGLAIRLLEGLLEQEVSHA